MHFLGFWPDFLLTLILAKLAFSWVKIYIYLLRYIKNIIMKIMTSLPVWYVNSEICNNADSVQQLMILYRYHICRKY